MWWQGPNPSMFSASRIESVPVLPNPVPITLSVIRAGYPNHAARVGARCRRPPVECTLVGVGFVAGAGAVAAVIGALALASLAASGCEGGRALPGADGRGGGAGAAAAGGAGSVGGAAAPAGAGGHAGGSVVKPWPVTLRLVNAGGADILLPELGFVTCGFSISVAATGSATVSHLTSATRPDTWCDCTRCEMTGRRDCDTVDPLCDGPPTRLAAGKHLDFEWDGLIAVTNSAPPSGSSCLICDHWETVGPPGDYVFTIETLDAAFVVQATLSGAAGVILLSVNGGH